DFNDDYTLCYDNPLFDEEFEDISSLDPPKSTPVNYEPLGNPGSVSRSLETSDLNLKELTTEIGLYDSIPNEIDDVYYDLERDILFLEHLLIEKTFSDPTLVVLPKKSTLLITPPPASKQSSLREVERFDTFFSLTRSGGKTRVIETPSFGFIICHHPSCYILTEGEIPSDESKFAPVDLAFKKVEEFPEGTIAAIIGTRWLANGRLPRVHGNDWYKVLGFENSIRARGMSRVAIMKGSHGIITFMRVIT
nr:hypothetical protein [Tanacetum cinerariifolium]